MMDEKMKNQIVGELAEVGIDKGKIDDQLIWGVKKLMIGMMKINWSLEENGLDETKIKKILKKIVEKMIDMDMSKMEKMEMHDHWHK